MGYDSLGTIPSVGMQNADLPPEEEPAVPDAIALVDEDGNVFIVEEDDLVPPEARPPVDGTTVSLALNDRYVDAFAADQVAVAAAEKDLVSSDTTMQGGAGTKPDEKNSYVYFAHKVGKQLGFWGFWSAANLQRTSALYQTYTSRYRRNPEDEMFRDALTVLYRRETCVGHAAERVFLPREFRKERLTDAEISRLHDSKAHRGLKQTARLMKFAEISRLAGDGAALASCFAGEGRCKGREMALASLDTVSTTSWYAVFALQGRGAKIVEEAGHAEGALVEGLRRKGYAAFRTTTHVRIGANALEVLAGGFKVGLEVRNYFVEPDKMSPAALLDGAINASTSGAWLAYSHYYLKEAARTLATTENNFAIATDVMAAQAFVPPPKLLLTMRVIGVGGAVVGVATNGFVVYEGLANEELRDDQRTKRLVSGSMGIAASLCFAGSSFFMTPAAQPLGAVFMTVGAGLMVAQTLYDEYDDIASFFADRGTIGPELPPPAWPKYAYTFDGVPMLFEIPPGPYAPELFPAAAALD